MHWEIIALVGLITGTELVHGQESGIFDAEFSLISMLIIVLFCFGGVYLCLYFTCCHEYLCTAGNDVGCCGDLRNEELKANGEENGNVIVDSSQIIQV